MINNIIERETERLIIRQWRDSDFDAFSKMCGDHEVMAFFPTTLNVKESHELALRCQGLIAEHNFGFWALEDKRTQKFVGFTGLHHVKDSLPFAPAVEIGWRLSRDCWGQGYATEAAREALNVGFETLKFEEIVSFSVVDNMPSRAVMNRLNMQQESQTFEHPDIPVGSPLRTHCLYRLSRSSWLESIKS